jgi:predicted transposase YbfD/YdcC
MPSSRTAPATSRPVGPSSAKVLLELLAAVPDPRRPRGVRHSLPGLLAVAIAAVVSGARSFAAIGQWVGDADADLLAALGFRYGRRPSESAIRRAFGRLDAAGLDVVPGAWMWTRTHVVGRRRVITIDAKTIRGARTINTTAPHLVAAFDHGHGVVLGQLAIAAKSNEIPAVRTLLATFDLNDVVVTVDAMHTQTDTAQLIVDGGGDYVFTVKNNQPKLYAACKALPWSQVPARRTTNTGHGPRVTPTIKVVTAPAWVELADTLAASPTTLAAWVQGHWGSQNKLHRVRDVTFDEDRSQIRAGAAPQVMATLRNLAISLLRLHGWTNIAHALRHQAADNRRPPALLTT